LKKCRFDSTVPGNKRVKVVQIITTHKSTDFDALASVIAGTVLYPDAVPVLPVNVNPNVKSFLSLHKDLFEMRSPKEIDPDKVKQMIVVDANSWGRLDKMDKLKAKDDLEIIMWDHHSGSGDLNPAWKCQEIIGANITLMVRKLKKKKQRLTPIHSTLFLTGLYEDTGNLSFPSTTAEDARAAAYLLEHKADLNVLNSFLRPVYGEKQKDVLFEMLQSTLKEKVNGFNISFNIQEINGHVSNLSAVVHMYREILNVDAAFGIFISKERSRCMVIGRSSVDELNIGSIMRSMGGGGHPAAGSAMLKSVNPDAVKDWIMELIEGNQQSSVQISDLMSYPVFTVPPECTMEEFQAILKEKGCTGLPVVDDGKMVGVVSIRDFKKIRKKSQMKSPVKAFMSTNNIVTIEPGKSPMEAARIMVKHDIGRLPVVEDGKIIGIITRTDAMRYFYDLLPE